MYSCGSSWLLEKYARALSSLIERTITNATRDQSAEYFVLLALIWLCCLILVIKHS
ncbi:hypothetical protein Plhal703r1_c06g0035121 [Plasmopara halstedii]